MQVWALADGPRSLFPQGMPDYPPPSFVVDALIEATKSPPLHQYTRGMVSQHIPSCDVTVMSQGHPRLVNALGKLYSMVYGKDIDPMTNVSAAWSGRDWIM